MAIVINIFYENVYDFKNQSLSDSCSGDLSEGNHVEIDSPKLA